MTALHDHLGDYLRIRRALGYQLDRPEKLLGQFADHLAALGVEQVTIEAALDWATLPVDGSVGWWALRLSAVRGFAAYLHTLDPVHQVPPASLLPHRPMRATPYLYSDTEISALMAGAGGLRGQLRQATYRTLIGLLVVTGIRVGEAIRLDLDDLDLAGDVVTVRHGKFGKSRLLPLHPSTVAALDDYLRTRQRLAPKPSASAFFISPAGTRLLYCNVHATFQQLASAAGLRPRSAACRPRPHDLRHGFAVNTVLDWYRRGEDAAAGMATLSTYLGHVDPAGTYWYLSASPELLALAAGRLEDDHGDQR